MIKATNELSKNNDNNNKELDYDTLASVVNSNHKYLFLNDIIPIRITLKELEEAKIKDIQMENNNQSINN